jgi:transcriptional regulator with XRE-family HTH domain
MDIMIDFMISASSLKKTIAARVRERRLALSLTQEGLSARSGVSLGTLKKFEHTGQISLESLIKLAIAVDAAAEFNLLFQKRPEQYKSLDELLKEDKKPKRGKIK